MGYKKLKKMMTLELKEIKKRAEYNSLIIIGQKAIMNFINEIVYCDNFEDVECILDQLYGEEIEKEEK